MEENKKTTTFKKWIESVPHGDYKKIKERIIEECFISKQVFRHWEIGNSNQGLLQKTVINKIAMEELNEQVFKIE